MITESEFIKARNSARRRQTTKPDGTVRQKAGSIVWMLTESPRAKVSGRLNSQTRFHHDTDEVPTADWCYSRGHRIRIGAKVDETFNPVASGTEKVEIIKQVIAHETCHGSYSEIERAPVMSALKAAGLKFRLHNLFEDCRIEWRYVADRGKAHKFGWSRLYKLPLEPTNTASTLLWYLKMREPVLFKTMASAMAPLNSLWTGLPCMLSGVLTGQPITKVIRDFYTRIVNTASEIDLIPIEKEWVDIFGHDVEAVTNIGSHDESSGTSAASGDPSEGGGTPPPSTAPAAPTTNPTVSADFSIPGDIPLDVSKGEKGFASIKEFTRARYG